MPKFAANISWLFTEVPFADRPEAAAAAGFKGVECLFPYELPARDMAARLRRHDLQAVLINAPPGDWEAGDRGLACVAGREEAFLQSLEQAVAYAGVIGCPRIHIMAGLGGPEDAARYVENLKRAGDICARAGLTAVIEPINDIDMPGYFLTLPEQAMEFLHQAASPGLGLQLDLYHAARMGLDPATVLERCFPAVAHFQVAGVPGRHEPDRGEVDFSPLFKRIDALGYQGWIGCEYRPRTTTLDGLAWVFP